MFVNTVKLSLKITTRKKVAIAKDCNLKTARRRALGFNYEDHKAPNNKFDNFARVF